MPLLNRWSVLRGCLALGALTLLGPGPLRAQEPVPCSGVRPVLDRLERGLLEEARTAYDKLDSQTVEPACLAQARDALAAAYRRAGDAFAGADARDQANEAYGKALALRPDDPETRSALLRLTGGPFGAARRLAAAGEVEEARKLARKALEEQGGPLPEDLAFLFGGPWKPWRELRRAWSRWILPVLEMLLVLAVAALLAWVALRTVLSIIRRKLLVEAFDSDGVNAPPGSGFARLLQTHLSALAMGERGAPEPILTSQTETIAVPDLVGDLSPQTKPVVTAANALLARLTVKIYRVAGTLHSAGEDGPGVTIQLRRGNRAVGSTTLWASQFSHSAEPLPDGSPAPYYRLAEMAAVWLLFALGHLKERRRFRLLGTGSWKAFALFRCGVGAQDRRRTAATPAERDALCSQGLHWYRQALGEDPALYAAYNNMAALLWTSPSKEPVRLLEAAISRMEGSEPDGLEALPPPQWDTVWERLRRVAGGNPEPDGPFDRRLAEHEENAVLYYQVRHYLLSCRAGSLTDEQIAQAAERGEDLPIERDAAGFARDLERTAWKLQRRQRRWFRSPTHRQQDRHALTFLQRIARVTTPVAVTIELAVELAREKDEVDPALERRIDALRSEGTVSFDGLFSYNAGCLFAYLASVHDEQDGKNVESAARCLARAVQMEPFRRTELEADGLLAKLRDTEPFQRELGPSPSRDAPPNEPVPAEASPLSTLVEVLWRWLERRLARAPAGEAPAGAGD